MKKLIVFISVIFILSCSDGPTNSTEPSAVEPTGTANLVKNETITPKLKESETIPTIARPTETPPTTPATRTPEPMITITAIPSITPISNNLPSPSPTKVLNTSISRRQVSEIKSEPPPTAIPSPTPSPTKRPAPINTATPKPLGKNKFTGPSFNITLNEEFDFDSVGYTISGLQGSGATTDEGIFKFEYSGSEVILYWLPSLAIAPGSLLDSAYTLLVNSQPENDFLIIGEGGVEVSDNTGRYGSFLINSKQGKKAGGGLMGAWTCSTNNTDFVVSALGTDATVLQIRFDRLIIGFKCGGGSNKE